ncbi:MAG TPA: 5'-nucleotidase [Flavobacterium sp.]|nr:5'-nucleotidase [Flavobacterium sp.]
MVNLKKYHAALKQFVLFLTFLLAFGCGTPKYHVTKIEGKEIGVTDKNTEVPAIEAFIKPYRDNIDKDMNVVLAYAPETLDKSGEWQCAIGNVMADATLDLSNRVFLKRENKKIDMCLLNFGGIRSIIPKGNITTRTAFEIMPFENSVIVTELKGEEILEMISYIITEKKAHPISGLAFKIGTDKIAEDIRINGQAFDPYRTYLVVTSDYLVNGGDNMNFFRKSLHNYDLDYKLRNVLIDYFREKDTIKAPTDIRISKG